MASKITAQFGADISEVEAKMMAATRSANYYKKAVESIDGKARNAASSVGEIAKKFTGGKILESLLGGVGLGSGFAVAQKASELISDYWKKAAESAEKIADFSTKTANALVERLDLRKSDDQRLQTEKRRLEVLEQQEALAAENAKSSAATDNDRKKASEAIAAAEEQRLKVAKMQIAADEKANSKKKQQNEEITKLKKQAQDSQAKELEDVKGLEYIKKRIADLEKERLNSKIPEAERLKASIALFEFRKKERDIEQKAAEAAAKIKQDADEKAKKVAKEKADTEKDAAEKLKEISYEKLSDEKKLAEVIKKGKEAQAKAEKSGLASDKLEVAKLREEYDDLTESIKASKDAQTKGKDSKFEEIGLKRGEDGKLRRGKQIISEEDAKRTIATRERNDKLAARTGRSKSEEAAYLARIEKLLTPGEV